MTVSGLLLMMMMLGLKKMKKRPYRSVSLVLGPPLLEWRRVAWRLEVAPMERLM
jgi:hypothetical protein